MYKTESFYKSNKELDKFGGDKLVAQFMWCLSKSHHNTVTQTDSCEPQLIIVIYGVLSQ